MTTTTSAFAPTTVPAHINLSALFRPVLTALRFTGHFLVALVSVIFLGSAAEH